MACMKRSFAFGCVGFAIVSTGCFAGGLGGGDDGPLFTYAEATRPKDVVVDAQTLCAAEDDGSLSIIGKSPSSAEVYATDRADPSAKTSDPGFAPARCRALCGDQAYAHCLFVGEYDAFVAAKDVPGCGWAKTKSQAKLTCWAIETYRATCSNAVG